MDTGARPWKRKKGGTNCGRASRHGPFADSSKLLLEEARSPARQGSQKGQKLADGEFEPAVIRRDTVCQIIPEASCQLALVHTVDRHTCRHHE